MKLSHRLLASVTFAALTVGLATGTEEPPAKPTGEPKAAAKSLRKPLITLTANPVHPRVGDTVELTATVASEVEVALRATYHELTVLGEWDDRAKAVVLLERERYYTGSADMSKNFLGFKFVVTRVKDFPNEKPGPTRHFINEGGVKGFQNRVTPQKPGVYMLTTVWDQGENCPALVSTPIILSVEPKAK